MVSRGTTKTTGIFSGIGIGVLGQGSERKEVKKLVTSNGGKFVSSIKLALYVVAVRGASASEVTEGIRGRRTYVLVTLDWLRKCAQAHRVLHTEIPETSDLQRILDSTAKKRSKQKQQESRRHIPSSSYQSSILSDQKVKTQTAYLRNATASKEINNQPDRVATPQRGRFQQEKQPMEQQGQLPRQNRTLSPSLRQGPPIRILSPADLSRSTTPAENPPSSHLVHTMSHSFSLRENGRAPPDSLSAASSFTLPSQGITHSTIPKAKASAMTGQGNYLRKHQRRLPSLPEEARGKRAQRPTQGPPTFTQEALFKRARPSPFCQGLEDERLQTALSFVVYNPRAVSFEDVMGLSECKELLLETVILPRRRPDLFTGLRQPTTGVLLFGPPGNGKTLLATAVASECPVTFFSISASSVTSKFVGEGEKTVRALFGVARALSPSIIFIDEVDSILNERGSVHEHESSRRLKTEFLVQLDGLGQDASGASLLTIAATNRPGDLDDAVLRRFPKRIHVPLPNREGREIMLRKLLSGNECKVSFDDEDWYQLSYVTENFSGNDLRVFCSDLVMAPLRELSHAERLKIQPEDLRGVNFEDAKRVFQRIHPATTQKQLHALTDWNRQYGSTI